MKNKKKCSKCNQVKWTIYKTGLCKRCTSKEGQCSRCYKERLIYLNGYCQNCYYQNRFKKRLKKIENEFVSICEYNQYIFQLYISYIHRYNLRNGHIKQTNIIKQILEKEPLKPFLSWKQIYDASKNYKIKYYYHPQIGCPFIKIGKMLQELGVLSPRSDEKSTQIYTLLITFNTPVLEVVKDFVGMLKKTNRSQITIVTCLRRLKKANQWLSQNQNNDLLTVHTDSIACYIEQLKDKKYSHGYLLHNYSYLNMFYKWGIKNKRLFHNPCLKIKINGPQPQITICSEEQFKAIFKFIKNPKSNPEQALLLTLILFWGLKNSDLRFAKLENTNSGLKVILRRIPLTYGYKYYNREQVIQLPITIPWLFKLQQRFYIVWKYRYSKIKKDYPNQFLALPKNNHSIHPISSEVILKKVYAGTIAATGQKIPIRVLHQTCGYLYTIDNDASVLSRLGWSQSFAFKYTWLPKVIFHPYSKEK